MSLTTVVVGGLTLLAAALRFWRIGHQSFWYDEAFTHTLVSQSAGAMLGLLPRTELTPPLYYSAAWVWARVFGFGEAGLRSLSAVAGVLTVPVVYVAARRFVNQRAGIIAAALVACNPLLIWYAQEARSYAVLVLMASLSLAAFAGIRSERPSTRGLVLWALAAALTLTTHYYGSLAIIPQAIWLLVVHRRDRRVWVAVAAVAAAGAALLPVALTQRPNASWIPLWPLDRRLAQIPPQFLLGTGTVARTPLKIAGALAVLLAAGLLARRADPAPRRGALGAGLLGLGGFVLSLLLLVGGLDELITRNIIVVLIPLVIVLAGGLGARRAGVLGLVGAGALCTIGVTAALAVSFDYALQRPDWNALTATLGEHPPHGPRAIMIQHYAALMPLASKLPGLRNMAPRGARVRELDIIAVPTTAPGWFCWWGGGCNLVISRPVTFLRVPGFSRPSVVHVRQFAILRLIADHPHRVTPGELSRLLASRPFARGAVMLQRH
ncbi:MAG TPA: glycosyltransferase family 39 protein [Solirubrobacteraceae bacterium]|nr:glycosyltransferase family 39 protein [Solirubrobacteraceae bacterium]